MFRRSHLSEFISYTHNAQQMVPWFACCSKRHHEIDSNTRPLFGVDETFRKSSSSEKFRTKRSREL